MHDRFYRCSKKQKVKTNAEVDKNKLRQNQKITAMDLQDNYVAKDKDNVIPVTR